MIARPSFYCTNGRRWWWVQNADRKTAEYWLKRGKVDMSGGLAEYTFRKRYQARWWDTSRVLIGPPARTPAYSRAHLERAGICGLYAERI